MRKIKYTWARTRKANRGTSRVVLPPAEEVGSTETYQSDIADASDAMMSDGGAQMSTAGTNDAEMTSNSEMVVMAVSRVGESRAPARKVGSRRLKMTRGITVDSGAADPVMPRRMVRGRGNRIRPSKASRAGIHYVSATGGRIPNEGETDLHFETEEGHALNWAFQVAEVNKVLASVSYLVDNHHRVVFDKDEATGRDISFVTNKKTNASIKMRRDRNVWVIDAYIDEDAEAGFARPETAR